MSYFELRKAKLRKGYKNAFHSIYLNNNLVIKQIENSVFGKFDLKEIKEFISGVKQEDVKDYTLTELMLKHFGLGENLLYNSIVGTKINGRTVKAIYKEKGIVLKYITICENCGLETRLPKNSIHGCNCSKKITNKDIQGKVFGTKLVEDIFYANGQAKANLCCTLCGEKQVSGSFERILNGTLLCKNKSCLRDSMLSKRSEKFGEIINGRKKIGFDEKRRARKVECEHCKTGAVYRDSEMVKISCGRCDGINEDGSVRYSLTKDKSICTGDVLGSLKVIGLEGDSVKLNCSFCGKDKLLVKSRKSLEKTYCSCSTRKYSNEEAKEIVESKGKYFLKDLIKQ